MLWKGSIPASCIKNLKMFLATSSFMIWRYFCSRWNDPVVCEVQC